MPDVGISQTDQVWLPGVCRSAIQVAVMKGMERDDCADETELPGLRQSACLVYEDNPTLFQAVYRIGKLCNDKHYGFTLKPCPEGIPEIFINKYSFTDKHVGLFGRHVDWGPQKPSRRKLTVTLQLSPSANYQGGDLIYYTGPESAECKREQSSATVFPSWTLHEVTPLTAGERWSLVAFLEGPRPFF